MRPGSRSPCIGWPLSLSNETSRESASCAASRGAKTNRLVMRSQESAYLSCTCGEMGSSRGDRACNPRAIATITAITHRPTRMSTSMVAKSITSPPSKGNADTRAKDPKLLLAGRPQIRIEQRVEVGSLVQDVPFALASDDRTGESGHAEDDHVAVDGGLRQAQLFRQIGEARDAGRHKPQDAQSRLIAKRLVNLHQLDVRAHRVGAGGVDEVLGRAELEDVDPRSVEDARHQHHRVDPRLRSVLDAMGDLDYQPVGRQLAG